MIGRDFAVSRSRAVRSVRSASGVRASGRGEAGSPPLAAGAPLHLVERSDFIRNVQAHINNVLDD